MGLRLCRPTVWKEDFFNSISLECCSGWWIVMNLIPTNRCEKVCDSLWYWHSAFTTSELKYKHLLILSQIKTNVCGGIQKYFQYKFLDITSVFHDLYNNGCIFKQLSNCTWNYKQNLLPRVFKSQNCGIHFQQFGYCKWF